MKYSISFVEYIRRLPFVRLVIPFILGIVAEELIFKQTVNFSIFLAVSLVLFFALFFVRFGRSYKFRWLWGILVLINLFLLGAGIMKNAKHQSVLPLDQQMFFRAVIIDTPEPDERFTQLTVQITAYCDSSKNCISTDEKVRIFVPTDSISTNLQLGDVLMLNAKFQKNSPPKNPEEFDYAYYLARRGFFATSFIKSTDYKCIGHENLWLRKTIINIQTEMFNSIKNAGIDGDNFAVLRALIIGDKQLLSEELIKSYSTAGAMHVLAVSGLHVGLVFIVLNFLLRPLGKRRTGMIFKTVLIIFGLFLYVSLAAFAPSVCRACVMLTFVLIGNTLGKKTNIYNSLAASALFLLCINPYSIFEVGFQLSYCAVIAIVYFQPIMYRAIYIRNKILNYIFSLATVSISAQMGTSCLTIFYFHNFPNYFLITNILIIPLVTVIMFAVAATLILQPVPVIGMLTGKFLDICVSLANGVTKHIEQLPYSLTENMYINVTQTLIMLAAVIAIAFYF
jgi:competence protein ComEC